MGQTSVKRRSGNVLYNLDRRNSSVWQILNVVHNSRGSRAFYGRVKIQAVDFLVEDLPTNYRTVGSTSAPSATEDMAGIFVCGRQHSGNTMMAALFGLMPGYLATQGEEVFLECRARLDRLHTAVERAQWMGQHLKIEDAQVEAVVQAQLLDWARANPQARAIDVFLKASSLSAAALGKSAWARKATSYIFHVDEILREMPSVRLIYLVRNPFDLAASVKRRDRWHEHLVGIALSWNRGTALAMHYEKRYPARVHLMRYEKLVATPQEKIKRLCRFLGETYDPSLLAVPHVNLSDKPYELHDNDRGMSAAHVNYYTTTLTPAEILAIDLMASRTLLRALYPELPHYRARYSASVWAKAIGLIGLGLLRYPIQMTRHALRNKFPLRQYLSHRLRRFPKPKEMPAIAPAADWIARHAMVLLAALLGVITALELLAHAARGFV
jgi:hypothetical protein